MHPQRNMHLHQCNLKPSVLYSCENKWIAYTVCFGDLILHATVRSFLGCMCSPHSTDPRVRSTLCMQIQFLQIQTFKLVTVPC